MIRSIDSLPAVTTFQKIIRFVSLGVRLLTVTKGSNVDSDVNNKNMLVLMSQNTSADLKADLEDQLKSNLLLVTLMTYQNLQQLILSITFSCKNSVAS